MNHVSHWHLLLLLISPCCGVLADQRGFPAVRTTPPPKVSKMHAAFVSLYGHI